MAMKGAFAAASAPAHTFAAGWNAACGGQSLDPRRTTDWQTGWQGAMALLPGDREIYLFNAEKRPRRRNAFGGPFI
jgi:hypothetical protein